MLSLRCNSATATGTAELTDGVTAMGSISPTRLGLGLEGRLGLEAGAREGLWG